MDAAIFDELQATLKSGGPDPAIAQLCQSLRERQDYAGLFYALLLKKRHELGVSPIPTGPAQDLPAEVHAPYEEAIRDAGRLVGQLYLDAGDIPRAWAYFRMIGEPEPVAAALEKHQPAEGADIQPLVDIAFYQGVHPRRGFDLLLDHAGICNAITTLGGQEFPYGNENRDYCIKRLVHALYRELVERIRADAERSEGRPARENTVRELMAAHPALFEGDFYHIDLSHLSSVVQMSTLLAAGPELDLARELCEYGKRLSPNFQHRAEPPFENTYHDYAFYLAALADDRMDDAITHFRRKAEDADPETVGTGSAEVLVNLLLRLNRPAEALATARQFLSGATEGPLSCPSLSDLCQRAQDYQALAAIAREQNDPVHFMAGLIAANGARS